MSAPVIASHTTYPSVNTDSVVLDLPTGTSSGDLLLAIVSVSANRTITAPSGWTVESEVLEGTFSGRKGVYTKIAGGSEPASYTWWLSLTTITSAILLRITGASSSPVAALASDNTSNNAVSPSVTTAVANSLVVRLIGQTRDRTYTAPSGHTTAITELRSAASSIAQATAGASGTATWTIAGGGTDAIAHFALAISPASGGPSVSIPAIYYAVNRR
jgi:hypothetical protein